MGSGAMLAEESALQARLQDIFKDMESSSSLPHEGAKLKEEGFSDRFAMGASCSDQSSVGKHGMDSDKIELTAVSRWRAIPNCGFGPHSQTATASSSASVGDASCQEKSLPTHPFAQSIASPPQKGIEK